MGGKLEKKDEVCYIYKWKLDSEDNIGLGEIFIVNFYMQVGIDILFVFLVLFGIVFDKGEFMFFMLVIVGINIGGYFLWNL